MLDSADRDLCTRDQSLPGLSTLLDPERLGSVLPRLVPEWAGATAEVTYLRYKQGQNCLAGLRLNTNDGVHSVIARAWAGAPHSGWNSAPGVRHDADLRLSFLAFPQDPRLRGPRWLLLPETRERALQRLALPDTTELAVLAYKPERRLVVAARVDGEPVAVLKCHDATTYSRILAAQHALADAPPALGVTTAHRWNDRRHVLCTAWRVGEPVLTPSSPLSLFGDAGAALAAMHASRMPGLSRREPAVEGQRLQRVAGDVATLLPSARAILGQLEGAWHGDGDAGVVAPTHGDFYAKQLLATPTGIAILDFDEAALGDPASDLGLFVAHLERDVIRGVIDRERADEVTRAFLAGYATRGEVNERAVRWHTARGLVALAPHPFRHRAPHWAAQTMALLERAATLLHASEAPARRPPSSPLAGDDQLSFAAPLLTTEGAGHTAREATAREVQVRQATLVRHKAGRRCLVRWDVVLPDGGTQSWLAKVRAAGADHRTHRLMGALRAAGLHEHSTDGVSVAEPLGLSERWHCTLQRAVDGRPLARGVMPGAGQVARALHRLHTAGVSTTRRWSVDDELALLADRLAQLAHERPNDRVRVEHLWPRVERLAAPLRHRPAHALLHRDFYHDQLLVDGERLWLLDLDCAAMGDPALDAGNFLAHLVELEWRGQGIVPAGWLDDFLDGVARVGMAPREAVSRWALLSLVRLLEIATRHADRRWAVPPLWDRIERLVHAPFDSDWVSRALLQEVAA